MDFSYSPQEEAFRKEVREWLQANMPSEWKKNHSYPKDINEYNKFIRDWQKTLNSGGWSGMSWPKAYGGRGATLIEQFIFDEEMILNNAPISAFMIGTGFIGPTLIQMGTEEQKKKYLANILNGKDFWCQGFSEPDAGSDLVSLKTTAVDMGDHFIVNGQKVWTSYGHIADYCLLLVRTDPKAEQKHKGLSMLIMDMKSPGIELRPIKQISGEADFNEMFLTDVKIPKENLVGPLNKGWMVAMVLLSFERRSVSGTIRTDRFFPTIVEYCRNHTRNGVPYIKDPVLRDKLAQLYIDGEIVRLSLLRGLSIEIKRGTPGPESSLDKIFGGELNKRMQSAALEILGEDGLMEATERTAPIDEGGGSFGFLDSFQATIGGGTTEIQRSVVAERLLGLPKD